jgi:hypothetical protein
MSTVITKTQILDWDYADIEFVEKELVKARKEVEGGQHKGAYLEFRPDHYDGVLNLYLVFYRDETLAEKKEREKEKKKEEVLGEKRRLYERLKKELGL